MSAYTGRAVDVLRLDKILDLRGGCGVGCGVCEKGGIRDDSKVSSLNNWNTGAVLTQMDGN